MPPARVSLIRSRSPLIMVDEIVNKWAQLRLSEEEEDTVELGNVEDENQRERLWLSLVGKLFTTKSYNEEAIKKTMQQIWNFSKGVIIRTIGNNLFIIQFLHWKDKEKVQEGATWTFNQYLLVLQDIDVGQQPELIELFLVPFWVRLYDLPLGYRNAKVARVIVGRIGEVLIVDEIGWDKSMRVRIMIDVRRPLKRMPKNQK